MYVSVMYISVYEQPTVKYTENCEEVVITEIRHARPLC